MPEQSCTTRCRSRQGFVANAPRPGGNWKPAPRMSATTTAAGTCPAGRAHSIGISTSSTGHAKPLPTSSSIRDATAYTPMNAINSNHGSSSTGVVAATRRLAATANKAAVVPCVSRSRREGGETTRSRDAPTSSVSTSIAAVAPVMSSYGKARRRLMWGHRLLAAPASSASSAKSGRVGRSAPSSQRRISGASRDRLDALSPEGFALLQPSALNWNATAVMPVGDARASCSRTSGRSAMAASCCRP